MSSSGGSISAFVGSKWATILVVAALAGGAIAIPVVTGGSDVTVTCDRTAADSTALGTQVSASSNGQTICLTTSANYGTWTGTSKSITLIAQSGTGAPDPTSPTLTIAFGSGDTGFTIDGGMSTWAAGIDDDEGMMLLGNGSGAAITTGASNITLKNFRSSKCANRTWNIDPAPTNSNILIDHAVFYDELCGEATFYIWSSGRNTTGITIQNSLFRHLSTDALKLSGASEVTFRNNKIIDSHETNGAANHTDAIQFNSGSGSTIRGNWVVDADQCISGFDGQEEIVMTHNVVVDCIAHAITMMKDSDASTVAWNTIGPGGETNIICGNKTGLSGASLTNIFNNISGGVVLSGGGTTCTPTRNDHNSGLTQTYVGGSQASMETFDEFSDFCLDPSSSGYTAADDSGQVGACGGDYDPDTDGPPSGEGY